MSSGRRADILLAPRAQFPLALQMRSPEGAPLGDVFSFLSGLYFRGKLAYARAFARPPRRLTIPSSPASAAPVVPAAATARPRRSSRQSSGSVGGGDPAMTKSSSPRKGVRPQIGRITDPSSPGVLVITPSRGLQLPDYPVTTAVLQEFARVRIEAGSTAYSRPLEESARLIAELAGPRTEVVLLGSIATGKYADILQEIFGARLRFPAEFVGRGDMSRGGLMLRCVRAGVELTYVPVAGAVRHGQRPPRLEPLRRGG